MKAALNVSVDGILEHSEEHLGQKVFVDCGFNSGRVIKHVLQKLPAFKIHGFEVNEALFAESAQKLKALNPNILSLNFAAVSDNDGKAVFREIGVKTGLFPMQGTTIVQGLDPERGIVSEQSVDCVDFSSWLTEIYKRHSDDGSKPYIAVKMDIEGAEYDVLQRMLDENTIDHVNHLSIEFHARLFPGQKGVETLQHEKELRSALAARSHLQVFEWV
jgi:FkbM family methyltransferase